MSRQFLHRKVSVYDPDARSFRPYLTTDAWDVLQADLRNASWNQPTFVSQLEGANFDANTQHFGRLVSGSHVVTPAKLTFCMTFQCHHGPHCPDTMHELEFVVTAEHQQKLTPKPKRWFGRTVWVSVTDRLHPNDHYKVCVSAHTTSQPHDRVRVVQLSGFDLKRL